MPFLDMGADDLKARLSACQSRQCLCTHCLENWKVQEQSTPVSLPVPLCILKEKD